MFGTVMKKAINKMGLPYVIVKGSNGITYYCDNRGMESGKVEELVVGTKVEYRSYKDKNGKLIATHLVGSNVAEKQISVQKAGKQIALDAESKEFIREVLVEYVKNNGPVMLTTLNAFLLRKKYDYHDYGYAKPKKFFKENFADVLEFEDIDFNGCPQTQVNLRKTETADEMFTGDATATSEKAPSIYEEFEQLIENERYEDALCSNLLKTISLDKLPFEYIEMAIRAARKILGINEELLLSDFDKTIITTPVSNGLFVMKKDTEFMKIGREECFDNCNEKVFQRFFNELIETNTHNTTYLHIAIRFQTVYNKLYLPFYVLAAYTSKKLTVADEFLKFTQKKYVFDSFVAFNKIVKETIYSHQEIDANYITKVLSIALDSDRFDLFTEFCSEVLGGTPAFVRWINEEELQCEKIVSMLAPNGFLKEKIVEKYINFYMYKKLNDGTLNDQLIHLLSEIAYEYPIPYLEEILANNNYVSFSRMYKKGLLVNNLSAITEYIKINPKAYVLACFVIKNFAGDNSALLDKFSLAEKTFTNEYTTRMIANPKELQKVYPLFKLDPAGQSAIEEVFCDYMDAEYPKCVSAGEAKAVIYEFNSHNCPFATVYYVENLENKEELLLDGEIASAYLEALKNTTNYANAIRYVKTQKASPDSKAREIIRILYMNFKELGVSSMAYAIFDDDFTLELAESLSLEYFTPTNGTPIILMAIYMKKNDLTRVQYLYSIYYELTKTGNRTFYNQLHRLDARISGTNSHYKVFRSAFTSYDYLGIVSFLDWTSRIIIDGRYTARFEICKTEIDRLIKKPHDKQNWEAILTKLSKDNIRQINSAFGYAMQCVYLLKFYNLSEEPDRQAVENLVEQLSYFASFGKVNETTNFIDLNIEMIDVMPETYVIRFAEFFKKNCSIFAENAEIDNSAIKKFYLLLLKKYNETSGEEYINLAIMCYEVFSSRLELYPDYYKSFSKSTSEKIKFFKMLFKLYSAETAMQYHDLIYYYDWNCSDEELQALKLLRIVYSYENDDLPENLYRLPARLLQRFKCDVSMLAQNYPILEKYNTLMTSDEGLAYKYLVLQYVMQIAFDQNVYWDISDKYWDVCDQSGIWSVLSNDDIDGISAALGFFKVSYTKQCKYVQTLGIEYITRRYINLYLIDLYDAILHNAGANDVSDEYIVELMRENNHVALIYDRDYKVFKARLNELLDGNLTTNTKTTLLLSLIRGSLCPLFGDDQVINEVINKTGIHEKIKSLFEMTGYPSVAQSALFLYFNSSKVKALHDFCEAMLPSVFTVFVSYEQLQNEASKRKMYNFISYAYAEMNHKQFLSSVMGNKFGYYDESDYQACKAILINVIIATVFNYNILRDLGNMVRQGKFAFSDVLFKDLLVQMKEESVYNYLCAVRFALNSKRTEATAAFYMVGGKKKIPELWESEYENLDHYIKGEVTRFKTTGIFNDFSAQKEEMIGNTILVDIAMNSVSEIATLVTAKSAMEVFLNRESTPQEKLNAGALILSFIKNDALQFVQNISRAGNIDSEDKMTYNEFLFEYGLLVVKSRKTPPNKKVDVIVELFEYFELLNDKNRRKFEENLRSTFANLLATAKSKEDVIPYEQWIVRFEDIHKIVETHNIILEGYSFFKDVLERCVKFEKTPYTVMEKISYLESLPEGISVDPITKHFMNSAKKELEKLRNGVMAKVSTINSEIEEDSIFVVLENLFQSHVTIDLSPKTAVTKFVVNVVNRRSKADIGFETFCSGNIENIRPGQSSGERIRIPKYITNMFADGDIIDVFITLEVNSVKVCRNIGDSTRYIYRNSKTEQGIPMPPDRYNYSSCAFTAENKGFGRTSDKEWLDRYIPTKGLSIIYGPSRVGKSSLLKYITNYLAVDYKKHTGTFSSSDKKIDVLYVTTKEDYHNFPEAETARLDYLFLEPIRAMLMSIVYSDMIDSEDQDGDNISREAAEQILRLLDKSELTIEKKLKTVSKVLSNNHAEIWILLDEFQQVVNNWSITQSTLFMSLCKHLKESIDNIKYVLCGADELVKLMINRDPVMTMYNDKTRAISQFTERDKKDYHDMLCDSMVWGDSGHPFVTEALDYIFTYTGGNAMYGKLICDRLIDAIELGEFANRKNIYPFDVSYVVAKMLAEQKSDIHATSAVNKFIANVTKNLESESPYLIYIAMLMMKESDRTYVTSTEIYDYFGAISSNELRKEIDTALYLCCVRGILITHEENREAVYAFSTTFYLDQYCEILKREGVPARVENNLETESAETVLDDMQDPYDFNYLLRIAPEFDERYTPRQQRAFLGALALSGDDSVRNSLRELAGTNIGTQNNVNYSITNTLNGILAAGNDVAQILNGLQNLPRLESYFGSSQIPLLEELESDVPELAIEAETRLESSTTKMVSDYLSALVSNNDTPDEFCVWDILGVSKSTYGDITKKLVPSFMAELILAAKLDYIFELAKNTESTLDFSPVCIMYCKVLEKALRFYHTRLYQAYFPDSSCAKDCSFGELISRNERERISIQNNILLGNFLFPIKPGRYREETDWVNIPEYLRRNWRSHGKMLNQAVSIRNKSAHGNSNGKIVGAEQLSRLKSILFCNDGLLNIIELAEE